jgi:DNA polymerase III delta subunit
LEYSRFLQDLRAGKIATAYLFIGKEDYLAETGTQELVAKVLTDDEKDLNYNVVFPREAETLPMLLSTPPMFARRRVIIAKQAGELNEKPLEAIISYLRKPPQDSCLILLAGEPDKRRSFFKRMEELKAAHVIDPIVCAQLKSNEMSNWVLARMTASKKSLDKDALSQLLAVNWPSLRELAAELDRLLLMVGEKKTVTAADVEEMGKSSFEFERYHLGNAVSAGDRIDAFRSLENLLSWGSKPTQIIGDLYRQFWQLWIVKWHGDHRKRSEANKYLNVKEFILRKLEGYVERIPLVNLETALIRILDAELNIKRGLGDEIVEVNLLILELVNLVTVDRNKRAVA